MDANSWIINGIWEALLPGLSGTEAARILGWCSCTEKDINWDIGHSFHISPNVYCPLCKDEPPLNNDHYHCHVCTKLPQIG